MTNRPQIICLFCWPAPQWPHWWPPSLWPVSCPAASAAPWGCCRSAPPPPAPRSANSRASARAGPGPRLKKEVTIKKIREAQPKNPAKILIHHTPPPPQKKPENPQNCRSVYKATHSGISEGTARRQPGQAQAHGCTPVSTNKIRDALPKNPAKILRSQPPHPPPKKSENPRNCRSVY